MHFAFAGSPRKYLLMMALAAFILLVSGMFSREVRRSDIQVQFEENVSSKVKDTVEALVQGQIPKADVSEGELKTRQAYATKRFGSPETDRGRFYVSMGMPDEIESHRSPKREIWVYRRLKFSVTFTEQVQSSTSRPAEVPSTLWIPLSEHSGIALRDTKFGTFRSKAMAHGTLMAKVDGIWLRVSLDSEPEIMPVGK